MVYNFTYTGSTTNYPSLFATGSIYVTGKAVTSGYANVSGTGSIDGYYDLVPGEGSTASFIWDSVFDVTTGTWMTTTGGLQFMDSNGNEVNMWANNPGSFSLYGHKAGDAAQTYVPADNDGRFGFSPAPTPGALALIGLAGAICGRRRRAA